MLANITQVSALSTPKPACNILPPVCQ